MYKNMLNLSVRKKYTLTNGVMLEEFRKVILMAEFKRCVRIKLTSMYRK